MGRNGWDTRTVPAPLGIPVDVTLLGDDAAGLADFARAAERSGIARLWAPELYRSATVPLAVAAAATERIELGTGIALAFTRSPMVTALEALDLDELSGGRFVLGLGAGVRRLNQAWHAGPTTPRCAGCARWWRPCASSRPRSPRAATRGRPGSSTTWTCGACAAPTGHPGPPSRSGSRPCCRA